MTLEQRIQESLPPRLRCRQVFDSVERLLVFKQCIPPSCWVKHKILRIECIQHKMYLIHQIYRGQLVCEFLHRWNYTKTDYTFVKIWLVHKTHRPMQLAPWFLSLMIIV